MATTSGPWALEVVGISSPKKFIGPHQVVTIHWRLIPLTWVTLIEGSSMDMELVRLL